MRLVNAAKHLFIAYRLASAFTTECNLGDDISDQCRWNTIQGIHTDEQCSDAKKVYPKIGVLWPIPQSGPMRKSCQLSFDEVEEYGVPSNRQDNKWMCDFHFRVDDKDGFVINSYKVQGVEVVPSNGRSKNVAVEMKLAQLDRKYISPKVQFGTRYIKIDINVEKPNPTHRPKIQDPAREAWPNLTEDSTYETWPSNEKFKLKFRPYDADAQFTITADTLSGVLHALNTIDNMVESFNIEAFELIRNLADYDAFMVRRHLHTGGPLLYTIPYEAFDMEDWPKYPVRGVLLDTGSSYQPMSNIKELIDLMALAKLNTLQWMGINDQYFSFLLGTTQSCSNNVDGRLICEKEPWDGVTVVVPTNEKKMNLTQFVHGDYCLELEVCAALSSPEAGYDRTDIAEIVIYAWLSGINVLFGLESPSQAGSWTAGQIGACQLLDWNDSTSEYGVKCSRDSDKREGPYSDLMLMCWGPDYQNTHYCDQTPCGTLNISQPEDSRYNGFTTKFRVDQPMEMFKAIVSSFNADIDEWNAVEMKLANMIPWLNPGKYGCEKDRPCWLSPSEMKLESFFSANSSRPRLVNEGDYFHLGFKSVKSTCLDGYQIEGVGITDRNSTVSATVQWILTVVEIVRELNWNMVCWLDEAYFYPRLTEILLEYRVVPQIFSDTPESLTKARSALRVSKSFIWSPATAADLDCGFGHISATGILEECGDYKTFWDFYGMDPDMMEPFALSYATRLDLTAIPNVDTLRDTEDIAPDYVHVRSHGGIAPLRGDMITPETLIGRVFPRAGAMAAGLWTGRKACARCTLPFPNGLEDFDHSSIYSDDFVAEWVYTTWSMNLLHNCHAVQPEKSIYCGTDSEFGESYCKHFSKSVYEELLDIEEVQHTITGESQVMLEIWFPLLLAMTITFCYGIFLDQTSASYSNYRRKKQL